MVYLFYKTLNVYITRFDILDLIHIYGRLKDEM